MRRLIFAASALTLAGMAPASAQMAQPMMPGMMGMEAGSRSCVMNGAFVPCPPPGGMGMGMSEPGMSGRRMSRREMRMQRRMMRDERRAM